MVPEYAYGSGSCLFPSTCPKLICGVHYLYFAVLLFFCTIILVLFVSYNTPPIEDKHVSCFINCWRSLKLFYLLLITFTLPSLPSSIALSLPYAILKKKGSIWTRKSRNEEGKHEETQMKRRRSLLMRIKVRWHVALFILEKFLTFVDKMYIFRSGVSNPCPLFIIINIYLIFYSLP